MVLYIGLMSGTSMDGIDAALVDVETHTLVHGITCAYSDKTQDFLNTVLNGERVELHSLTQLNTLIGREFSSAVHKLLDATGVKPQAIKAIGSHGQTIGHDPLATIPYTIQLGCPHTIASLTGITVVADFRTRDVILGGQGAPFAPLYHQALFEKFNVPFAVVNVGGVANVSFIVPGKNVCGYDTGPGNSLLDAQARIHLHQPYDANGAWAAGGQVIKPLLDSLLSDPYFKLPAPKSLDKSYFSMPWLAPKLRPEFSPQDIQATLVALTAVSICDAIKRSDIPILRTAICGGGVHNQELLKIMRLELPDTQIDSTQIFGFDPDFLEAMMFAWLADKTLRHVPIDLTHITGASRPSTLGAIYPP